MIGENLMRETLVNFTIKSGTEIPHPPFYIHNNLYLTIPPPQAIPSRNIWNKDIGNPLNTKISEKRQNPRPPSLIEDEPIYI